MTNRTGFLLGKHELKKAGQPYKLEQMRVQVLRDHALRLERVHLATHSAFNPQDYLRFHIEFFEEWLSLAGLISDETLDFHGMRLFYLSSCESGQVRSDAADELQGLVWALIYAGAEAVMAACGRSMTRPRITWPASSTAIGSQASRPWRLTGKPSNSCGKNLCSGGTPIIGRPSSCLETVFNKFWR